MLKFAIKFMIIFLCLSSPVFLHSQHQQNVDSLKQLINKVEQKKIVSKKQ